MPAVRSMMDAVKLVVAWFVVLLLVGAGVVCWAMVIGRVGSWLSQLLITGVVLLTFWALRLVGRAVLKVVSRG